MSIWESEGIMNNLSKNFKDDEGKEGTLIASSTDNYEVKLNKTYIRSLAKLSNGICLSISKIT